jgi:TonB family protein
VLPEGVAAADLSGIELVVERDGSVESVKLVHGRRPASVKDAMLLSAAKTWRFAPATKERVPVRYRKTIWIISE